jgi:hypothetical protein
MIMRRPTCLVLLGVLASTAHAGDNEVSLTSSVRALRSHSANALSDDSFSGGAMSYRRAIGPEWMPGLQLWVAGSAFGGVVDGVMFQTMTTSASQVGFTAGGRARYAFHRHFAASAGLELGAARTALTLDAGGRTASDHGWGPLAQTSAAVDVVFPARFTFGLRLELGYVAAAAVELTPTVADGDGTIQLPMSAASIGHLGLSGPSLGFSILGQF